MMWLLAAVRIWDVGMKGHWKQWDQALSCKLEAAAPATLPLKCYLDNYSPSNSAQILFLQCHPST